MRFRYLLIHGRIGLLIAIGFLFSCKQEVKDSLPTRYIFNNGWEFVKDIDSLQAFSGKGTWIPVKIPHTPKIEPLVVTDQWQGICWYRKRFVTANEWQDKLIFLKFEGAMNVADVWINGTKKIRHLGGYLPFTIDITEDFIPGDTNELMVRLDNRDNPVTGPKPLKTLDFNMYGGIYRDVYLDVKNKIYISDACLEGPQSGGGVCVRYPKANRQHAEILVNTHVSNRSGFMNEVYVEHQLFLGDSVQLTQRSSTYLLPSGEGSSFETILHLDKPKLWFPHSPNLYKLITHIRKGHRILDTDTLRIGIKRMQFREGNFYLNGEKTFLRGVNRHQEYPYIGYALSNEAHYRDALKIKEAGFDYVRLSHYPHDPAFLDACDELGLLVVDAILGWQYYSEDPAFEEHIYRTARELVRRDRNHACILAWEVSLNESWMPEYFIDSLHAIAHSEYPGDQCFTAGWQPYGYDIYLQARQHRLQHFEPPSKPYVVSEYGDWEYYAMNAGLNQDTWSDLQPEVRSSRQLLSSGEQRLLQQAKNVQEAHNDNFNTPAFADGYWAMYDYNRGYSEDLEASGIMSINRLPKFSYYFFGSQRDAGETSGIFSSGPMIFIASYWTENSDTDVRIFSNCEEVELFLNDSLIGRQQPDTGRFADNLGHPPFTFILENFQPGVLKAIGYLDNKPATEHLVATPVVAKNIKLFLDQSGKPPKAGVNDIVFVHAAIVDGNGTKIPVNNQTVQFSVTGNATLISPINVYTESGIASALLQIGDLAGNITIAAKTSGNINAQLEFISH
jgi:beta-galactosidase